MQREDTQFEVVWGGDTWRQFPTRQPSEPAPYFSVRRDSEKRVRGRRRAVLSRTEMDIINVLRHRDWQTVRELSLAVDKSRDHVNNSLNILYVLGKVTFIEQPCVNKGARRTRTWALRNADTNRSS